MARTELRRSVLTRSQFAALGGIVAVSGFFGGAVASRVFGVSDARAQVAPAASLVVPAQGLVFRAENGNAVGRFTASAEGGALEIYDSRGRVASRLGAGAGGGALDLDNPATGAKVRLLTTAQGSGLDLLNESGELAVRLAAQTGGGTVLLRADSAGEMRVVHGTRTILSDDPYRQDMDSNGTAAVQLARK